jgi:hypothetical protein
MTIITDVISSFQPEAMRAGAIIAGLIVIAFLAVFYGWPRLRRRKEIGGGYYQPVDELKPKRLAAIKRIEKKHGSRVIAIIHRAGRDERYIDEDTAEDMLNVLRQVDAHERLDIILHTPGGYTSDTLRIAFAVKAHRGHKTAYVPYEAMSGGTLIALAADEIVMADHAVLGPIDPSIGDIPAASLLELRKIRDSKNERIDDVTFLLADMAAKAMQQVRTHACELISNKAHSADQCSITDRLVSGEWTHDYPITKSKALELKLPISKKDVPGEMFDLIALYPNPKKQEPSVKFGFTPKQIEQLRLQLTLHTPVDHS